MSRSGDFRGDNRRTDRQTDYFTPAHARGVCALECFSEICTITACIGTACSIHVVS